MFNDDQAINHICKELNKLIAYCTDCKDKTSYNSSAWEIYNDTQYQLEILYYDIATSNYDEEEEE